MLRRDRKSTRLNSSHVASSYAVFCLKKKKQSFMLRLEYMQHDLGSKHYQFSDPNLGFPLITTYVKVTSKIVRTSLTSKFFFVNDTATTEIYTLSLHDALPISRVRSVVLTRKGATYLVLSAASGA